MPPRKRRDDFYRDRRRRKVCAFCADKSKSIDYKEVDRLVATSASAPRSSRVARRAPVPSTSAPWRSALKRARHVALLPYAPQHMRP